MGATSALPLEIARIPECGELSTYVLAADNTTPVRHSAVEAGLPLETLVFIE
jgi:hypothetical protein